MADIWEAYKFINSSLNLDISDEQLAASEKAFKKLFAEKTGLTGVSNISFSPDEWEFFADLRPITPFTETLRQQRRINDPEEN